MTETTLAAANVKIVHEKARNLSRFAELIDEAAGHGVDILVLPEAGLQGYADFALSVGSKECAEQKQYYFREAETIPGPATQRIGELARRHGMFVQLGLAERALHGNAIYNSTALIGPEGVIGVYRKVHNQFEFPYFSPGEELPVFSTPARHALEHYLLRSLLSGADADLRPQRRGRGVDVDRLAHAGPQPGERLSRLGNGSRGAG